MDETVNDEENSGIINTFVVSFCNEGLETVVPASDIQRTQLCKILAGKNEPAQSVEQIVGMLILRARFNQQRCYEIYSINAVDGITEEDIREMFDNSPQTAADLIRARGNKIHSDRAAAGRIKIT